jgi:hypothetical protein
MATRVVTPTCPDPVHARAGASPRKASPAVAIVRRRIKGARWAPRCRSCVQRLREASYGIFDVAYLQHSQSAPHDPAPDRSADHHQPADHHHDTSTRS